MNPVDLPHSDEAEASVLGSMILSPELAEDLASGMEPEDFYALKNGELFGLLRDRVIKHQPTDLVSLMPVLKKTKWDPLKVRDLTAEIVSPSTGKHHAQTVLELATVRRLIFAGQGIVESAVGAQDAQEALSQAEAAIYRVGGRRRAQMVTPMGLAVSEALDRFEKIQTGETEDGLSTGLKDLDNLIMGMQPEGLYIIAARPSVGKTALATEIVLHQAVRGLRTAFFSIEMSQGQITERVLCHEAGVSLAKVKRKLLTDMDNRALVNAADTIYSYPIDIIDDSGTTVLDIASICRRMKRKDLRLIVVDYLQLMRPAMHLKSREQEVAEMSRALKLLAKELKVPVLVCSQLNRESENRKGKHTSLADLRESGSIEQDADVVILLEYEGEEQNVVMAKVAKNRQGPKGQVRLTWRPELMRFDNHARI